MTSGVPPIDPTVAQSSSPWFFHSFNNSFTLDLPLLSTPRGWQINLQLIRPVALLSIVFWSGETDGELDL